MCRAVEELCKESQKETQKEMARRMLAMGKLTLEEIAECACLSLDEVQRLHSTLPR